MASAETQTDVELDGLLNRLVSLADEAGSATRAKGRPSRLPICSKSALCSATRSLSLRQTVAPQNWNRASKRTAGSFPSRPHIRRGARQRKPCRNHYSAAALTAGGVEGRGNRTANLLSLQPRGKGPAGAQNPTPGSSQKRRYVERFHLRVTEAGATRSARTTRKAPTAVACQSRLRTIQPASPHNR